MSFTDMIKKSVLEGFDGSDLTTGAIILTLVISIVLGLFIYFIYRTSTKGGFYNRSFNKALATMPVITAGIMLAMQSNLVISLGMVGALSIVRFRNAVKDSSDLTYIFWSISMGIIAGAQLYELAIILSLCIAVLIFALDLLPGISTPCLLVVSGKSDMEESSLLEIAKKYCKKIRVRSRNITKNGIEWIVELQIKDEERLAKEVSALDGVVSVNLLTHDGDVRF